MKLTIRVGLILLSAALAVATAFAEDGQEIAAHGTAAGAPACVTCHGEHGEGQAPDGYPALAGLNASYIEHQLASFKDGSRKSDIMQPFASALTDAERTAVADYYASLHPVHAAAEQADAKFIAAGKKLADAGDWSRGLPGCGQCHSAAGLGVGHTFPRLAGQSAVYLENQLHGWKTGDRKNDPMGLMANIAGKLTDDEIKGVAAYYAGLPVEAASETKP